MKKLAIVLLCASNLFLTGKIHQKLHAPKPYVQAKTVPHYNPNKKGRLKVDVSDHIQRIGINSFYYGTGQEVSTDEKGRADIVLSEGIYEVCADGFLHNVVIKEGKTTKYFR